MCGARIDKLTRFSARFCRAPSRMHIKIVRGPRIRHASLFDQPHSLKLELACKLPPFHDSPPVPSKHLTRCLRNRVQAMQTSTVDESQKIAHGSIAYYGSWTANDADKTVTVKIEGATFP